MSNLAGRVRQAVIPIVLASTAVSSPAWALPHIQVIVDGVQLGSLGCGYGLLCDEKGVATLPDDLVYESSQGDIITIHAGGEYGLMLDPDPQIVYSSTAVDIGAASTFNFVFSQSIVPTAAPSIVEHTLSSNTTDGQTNGVPVTAANSPIGVYDSDGMPEIAKYVLSQSGGAAGTFVSAGLDLQGSFTAPTGSNSQGPYTEGGAGPAGTYNFMRVDVNVTLGGGGDRYAFNGRASIEEGVFVPEPGTGALLGLGLFALAFRLRSRRD